MRALPWLALAAYITYRHTWGTDEVDALKRRLAVAHRESNDYLNEARYWRSKAMQLALNDVTATHAEALEDLSDV